MGLCSEVTKASKVQTWFCLFFYKIHMLHICFIFIIDEKGKEARGASSCRRAMDSERIETNGGMLEGVTSEKVGGWARK